jgi:hypothetical protein
VSVNIAKSSGPRPRVDRYRVIETGLVQCYSVQYHYITYSDSLHEQLIMRSILCSGLLSGLVNLAFATLEWARDLSWTNAMWSVPYSGLHLFSGDS